MSERFKIVEVAPEDAQAQESLGTKEKFWLRHDRLGLCLYKKSRSNTAGEDWSEKIAAELCGLLKLPHAEYELATCNGDMESSVDRFYLSMAISSLVMKF
ncbi:hypothetical protein [Chamaesiphon sp.]|uniref:hypothetical protein n=1 Tax=Chamaesiphon sp. TaxID=2814140 RepID=UPI0035934599